MGNLRTCQRFLLISQQKVRGRKGGEGGKRQLVMLSAAARIEEGVVAQLAEMRVVASTTTNHPATTGVNLSRVRHFDV